MANPFAIDMSGGNQYRELSGLADVISQGKERQAEEEAVQAQKDAQLAARTEIQEVMATNDPTKIRAVMAKYPEAAKGLKAAIETKFPGESGNALKNAYFQASIDKGNVAGSIQGLKTVMEQDGLDPQEIAKLDEYNKLADDNPEEFHAKIVGEFAAMTAGEDSGGYWDRYQDITKGVEGEKGFTLGKGQVRYDAKGVVIAEGPSGGVESYEGLTGAYKNWLIANEKESSPENFDLFQKNKVQLAADMRKQSVARPNVARLMAAGWVPSSRITEPMMDSYEAAAAKAEADGKPLSVQDLYNYEFNAQKNRATGRTAGGRLTLSRKQNIESGRELLQEMKVTAKKLDFSNIKMAGAFEKFMKGELSDPNFAEYMAQRADSLFVITAAMKMNGVTDKAIEIEEEAFPVNSSPRVFNAWFNTQMRALNRAAKEMDKDFKYGIKEIPTFPPGQGGAPTEENPVPTIESDVPAANKSDEELKESLGL